VLYNIDMVIDGKIIAGEIIARLKELPMPAKFLGAVLVGDDPASVNFLKQKERIAGELGVEFRQYRLPVDITTEKLCDEIARLAAVEQCGGLIVQLPLPKNSDRQLILDAVPETKDVDCLSEAALDAFHAERSVIMPPSVATVEEILKHELFAARGIKNDEVEVSVKMDSHNDTMDLHELKAIVIGAGFLVGAPVSFWLRSRVDELATFDIATENVHEKLQDADIVVSGTGHAHLFGAEHLKDGAIVIDFGFSRNSEGQIVGDFNPAGADEKNIRYTPTPGGTGPVLVAKLLENFYKLNP
jgi:methylenetetrahydrofolate dehydrogenase (NADP+)/methenyltetrahydrofolate cyclohydrolase